MNDTPYDDKERPLLRHLFALLALHRPIFRQERVYQRVVGLVLAEVFAFARHTVTQLLLGLGLVDTDWSGWYRLFSCGRFDDAKAAGVLLGAIVRELPATRAFMTGFDGFPVPRTSRRMPGTSWLKAPNTASFKPGIARAQRFVEGSWLTPLQAGFSRAIPLRCLPAFPPKAVPSSASPCKEWEAARAYLSWLRAGLDGLGRHAQLIVALADGAFDTLEMWASLPEGVALVVRTARNRCLYALPVRTGRPGRPPTYGPKAPAPAEWLKQRQSFVRTTVMVRGRARPMRYRLAGPFVRDGQPDIPLFLLVIGGGKRPPGSRRARYEPCFFLISALPDPKGGWRLPLPIEELLAWLWQRWELEVAHREMKSSLGLGEKQCWHVRSTIRAVQWSVWVYALLLLAGYQAWGLLGGPTPPGRWRRVAGVQRWSFNTLWRGYRAECWSQPAFRACWTPSPDNWAKMETFLTALSNAVTAAARA